MAVAGGCSRHDREPLAPHNAAVATAPGSPGIAHSPRGGARPDLRISQGRRPSALRLRGDAALPPGEPGEHPALLHRSGRDGGGVERRRGADPDPRVALLADPYGNVPSDADWGV